MHLLHFLSKLKEHIFQVAELLIASCQVIKDAKDSVLPSIKRSFIDPSWKYREPGDDSDQRDVIDLNASERIHSTGVVFNCRSMVMIIIYSIIDVLLYVADALPFLHAFCIHLVENQQTQDNSQPFFCGKVIYKAFLVRIDIC